MSLVFNKLFNTFNIIYQWLGPEDIHLVTGVSCNTDKSPPEVEVSNPFSDLHNNDPTLKNYNKWEVISEDPFETNVGKIRYLICISSTGVGSIWIPYVVLALTVIVAIAVTIVFVKYKKKR